MSAAPEQHAEREKDARPRELQGIGASPGIAIGPAFRFEKGELDVERRRVEDPAAEWERFEDALVVARDQLEEVFRRAEAESGAEKAAIFEAHAMMLEDPELLEEIRTAIQNEGVNAEAAMQEAAESYAEILEAMEDEYLSARAADVRDVAERVVRVLLDVPQSPAAELSEPSVILARDLTPSDTVLLDKSLVLGFCTAEGGGTSHTAILARSLGLPAVVGAGPDILSIPEGEKLVLDGTSGRLLVGADSETVEVYRERRKRFAGVLTDARERSDEPAMTQDGQRVEVVANIGNVAGAEAALKAGAEGVGLLRTEFLYLERDHLPSEDEQFEAYSSIVDVFEEQPVILRTLDIGGDKELPYLDLPEEMNPFLGVRAIRLCLRRPELFKPQLKAALRAGAEGNLKLMFPMVSSVAEVREARELLGACREELVAAGHAAADEMEVGIMVEVPSAVVMADHLAKEVDFFSIGTNDLTQYTMAADRTNADVAPLVTGFQPAVLRLVRDTIEAAHGQGKWVGLCGELAGEPLAIPILLGLGLDEFSMNPPAVPIAKQIIRQLNIDEARVIARDALKLDSPEAVEALVKERVPAADVR